MAVIQEYYEIDVEEFPPRNVSGLSIQRRNVEQGILHSSSPALPNNSIQNEESSLLLRNTQRHGCCEKVKLRFKSQRCCLRSSKAALLVLIWNLIVSFGIMSFLDPNWYVTVLHLDDSPYDINMSVCIVYGLSAFLYLFYPLAGCLADIRLGRYKTVINSLCFVFWSIVLLILLCGLASVGYVPFLLQNAIKEPAAIVALVVIFAIPIICGVILLLCSLNAFRANVIQFGLDQLHDAPTDDSVLYIHWYVWTTYVGTFNARLPLLLLVFSDDGYVLILYGVTIVLAFTLLGVTLCLQKYKRDWFHIESGSRNPYKLVFKVVKFAKEHSYPIRRSAFTYCEDELPSRIDLGKDKYGGPFTTEEVENVKAFWGIIFVLLTLGPIFTTDYAIHGSLQSLARNTDYNSEHIDLKEMYGTGSFTPLIIVIMIPVYLGLLRPFIHNYIPGMLRRIGLGMILLLLSGVCTSVMGSVGQHCVPYMGNSSSLYVGCQNNLITYFQLSPNFLLIQSILNAFGYMFLYIASYEFICAQSPHSMKGMLIGTFFAIKGVFQLLGILVLYVPFVSSCTQQGKFPLCGFIYYLINIVIALVGIVAFIIVSRRYQYRQRDEPDNIYRYAEEYYSK